MDPERDEATRGLPAREAVDAVAAHWVARRDAGLDEAGRTGLRAWLAADARHAAAFARADAGGTELDWPLHAGELDTVLAGLEERARRRRGRRRLALAGSVGACAVALLFVSLWRTPIAPTPPVTASSMVVKVPEKQTLPDGSIVELKDGARIAITFTDRQRLVTLTEGIAHFQVEKGERPFVVNARGVTAQALGTAFSVEVEAARVSVLVTHGRVAVQKETPTAPSLAGAAAALPVPAPEVAPAILDAGNTVSVALNANEPPVVSAVATVPIAEVEDRLSWRIPRLEFTGTPLSEVIATVNRHNRVQFVIEDASLERLTLSGILRADKVDALVAMIEADFPVQTEYRGERIVLKRRAR